MGGRLYDPSVTRFISPDPISSAYSQDLNRYSYVWNSPVQFTDPSGYEGTQTDSDDPEPAQKTHYETKVYAHDSPPLSPQPLVSATADENSSAVRTVPPLAGAVPGTALSTPDAFFERPNTSADISTTNLGGACMACHPAPPSPSVPPAPIERLDIGHPERYIPPELDIPFVRGLFYVAAVGDTVDAWMEEHPFAASVILYGGILRGSLVPAMIEGRALTLTQMASMLGEAATKKGNFGIGSGTAAEAEALGRAWVGPGYRVASDGKTLKSIDGLRQYRPPSYKPKLGRYQANFERRFEGQSSARWQSDAHLNITDLK